METKFQTSFIPKKALASVGAVSMNKPSMRRTSSLFMVLAVLTFIVSLGGVAGTYFYKQYLIKAQEDYKTQLIERQKQFNIDLIQQLKLENTKIDLAKQILNNHRAISLVFDILSRFTIESVRFLNLDLASNPSEGVKIGMNGYGTSLQAVAFQSDVLGQLERYGLRNIVKNPIMSDPTIESSGAVSFGFTASINPTNLSYKRSVTSSGSGAADLSGATSTAQ